MKPLHVGTWVVCCTPEGDLIKWGKDGDTEFPFPPDDKDAQKQLNFLLNSKLHAKDVFYILHVFSNGQIKTWDTERKRKLDCGIIKAKNVR